VETELPNRQQCLKFKSFDYIHATTRGCLPVVYCLRLSELAFVCTYYNNTFSSVRERTFKFTLHIILILVSTVITHHNIVELYDICYLYTKLLQYRYYSNYNSWYFTYIIFHYGWNKYIKQMIKYGTSGRQGDRVIPVPTSFATDPCRGSSALFVKNLNVKVKRSYFLKVNLFFFVTGRFN